MTSRVDRAATTLLAMRGPRALPPCALPDLSRQDAYAVQALMLTLADGTVAGWKVAIGPGGIPIAAPLLAGTILPSGSSFPWSAGRRLKLETEVAFRLSHDLPPRDAPYSRAEILGAVESVQLAFEVVGPRGGEPGEVPFEAFLADNLGNAFTVIGTPMPMPVPPLSVLSQILGASGTNIPCGPVDGGRPRVRGRSCFRAKFRGFIRKSVRCCCGRRKIQ